ncbi:hypothetical protein TIFTF001_013465 [Ficus carica]|uniref:Uncharacterized protein n=1 Tax=Ficus carica TaxID=3494 RepID=A0AA88A3J9_FICCA|nr:hypothetical protein TIFTF001_013465 [Ficus carica]
MGGCASKPKESGAGEAPASPKQVETQESIAQKSQNEAPLVDVSEPKEDADVDAVPAEATEDVSAKPEEEEKVEATPETKEEEDDDKVKVEAVGETEETPEEGQVEVNKTDGSDAAPASEDKSDAPLVSQ